MKKVLALVLTALMALSLVACKSPEKAGTTADNSAAATRDSVTCATNMVISQISPWDKSSLQNNYVRVQIYESFYYYNNKTAQYEPRVASDYEISEDGRTYTFHLRQDAKFQNGDPVLASDAVWSIEQAMKEPSMKSYTSAIESYQAVDDHTVSITTKDINAPFMMNLTWVFIVSEKACKEAGEELGHSAVLCGTGPYYVAEYNPDVSVVLKAFPDYYRGEAAIKTVTFKPIVDSSTGLIAFENGELDFFSVPTSDWKEISESGKYNTELVAANHIAYFGVNYTGVLENPLVREAIAHCIDKQALIAGAYDGLDAEASCMVNNSYVLGAPKECVTYDYNIAKAKDLLTQAGYPNGLDVGSILCPAGGYFEKMSLILQSSLKEAGMTCTVNGMEQAAALAQMSKGDFTLLCCGYTGEYDYDFWKIMTHSSGIETSYIKYKNAPEAAGIPYQKIDDLYDQGAKNLDLSKRQAIYKELDDLLMGTCTYLPVFYKQVPYAWNKDLNAVTNSNVYIIYDWSWNS